MRKTLIPLAAAVAAFGLLVPQASAARGDATGCGDIVSGGADYQRLVFALQQEQVLPGVYGEARNELLPRGVLTADLQLASASCTDVEYVLEVYSDQAAADGSRQLLATDRRAGDGSATALVLETVVNAHPSSTVHVQVRTVDRRGTDIDLGSDSGPLPTSARADGGPGGPGNIGWS